MQDQTGHNRLGHAKILLLTSCKSKITCFFVLLKSKAQSCVFACLFVLFGDAPLDIDDPCFEYNLLVRPLLDYKDQQEE